MQKRLISLGLAMSVAIGAAMVPAYATEVQQSAPEGMVYQMEETEDGKPVYVQMSPEAQKDLYASGKKEIYTPDGAKYNFTYVVNESAGKSSVEIVGCQGTIPRDLVLPNEIKGMPVTTLSWNALDKAGDIVSLKIPANMTKINDVFYHTDLQNFYVAEGNPAYTAQNGILYSKDMKTVIRCPRAKKGKLEIPSSVTNIGNNAYNGCQFLTGLPTFPAGLERIGSLAFHECDGLRGQVVLPRGLKTLENEAFYGCDNLVGTVTIPAGTTKVGDGIFGNCPGVTAIWTEEGNRNYTSLEGILYTKDCSGLICCPTGKGGQLNLPEGLRSIEDDAFAYCKGLKGNLKLPESLESVGYNAFQGTGISGNVYIPAKLTKIEGGAFAYCDITSFSVSPDNPAYSVWDGVIYDKTGCKLVAYPSGLGGNIIVPDGTTEILQRAINPNGTYRALYLPKSVTYIDFFGIMNSNFDKILYGGSEAEWNQITVKSGNYALDHDRIYYNQAKPGPCTWRQDANGLWWYDFGDGEYAVDETYIIDGHTFLFDEKGYMQTGWQKDNWDFWAYFNASGHMLTGWQQLDGNWYYFEDDGMMVAGNTLISGKVYPFSAGGIWDGTVSEPVTEDWHQSADGRWWYQLQDGNYAVGPELIDQDFYYFDENGYMCTGWIYYSLEWLQPFFEYEDCPDGCWIYADASGRLVNWWQQIDGNWYFFWNHVMLSDTDAIIDYAYQNFNASGVWTSTGASVQDGWIQDEKGWRYVENGIMDIGECRIDNEWHRFQYLDGYMAPGWVKIPDRWTDYWQYYEPTAARLLTGDQVVDGVLYHFDDEGYLKMSYPPKVRTGWQSDSTGWYYNDENGVALKGWQSLEGSWFYFNGSGYMQTGWQQIGGSWYYFNGSGYMQTSWQQIDGIWYYFNGSGCMQTGWQQIGGCWFYFNGSGYMQTGWQWIDGSCYYFYGDGAMASDTTIDGCYVNSSGVWVENPVVTGWQSDATGWYYNDDSGVALKGWQSLEGSWFYFNESGYMLTGWQWIGGCWFYFNGSGYMQTGWQLIDGSWYYFYESGAMAVNTTIDGYTVNGSGVMI